MVKPLAALTAVDSIESRHDGRDSSDFREPVVLCDLIGTCQGSASVRLGSTFVLAGVRAVQEVPSRTNPDSGALQVKVELTSLASATRHGSDSRDLSSTLTHQLQEQLYNNSFLDLKTLCLQQGKHCWHILVDVRVLNDDGGLLDASLLAASFALKSVQGKLIVDPTTDEEQRLRSCLSVCVNADGLCSGVECRGGSEVTPQILSHALKLARDRCKHIIKTVLGS